MAQTLIVKKNPGVGEFASISTALATISDSAENNQYVISVGPGNFRESVIDLTTKPYVSIRGSGWTSTYIFPNASNQTRIFKLGHQTNLSEMLISGRLGLEGAINANIVLVSSEDFGDESSVDIEHCQLWSATTFVLVNNSTFHENRVTLRDCELHGNFSIALSTEQLGEGSGGFSVIECYDVDIVPQYNVIPSISGKAVGTGSFLWMYGGYLYDFSGETYSGPNYTGQFSQAFQIENGADVELANITIYGFKEAIIIAAGGDAPQVRLTSLRCIYSLDVDLDNEHTGTVGVFEGVANKEKITNESETLLLSYIDYVNGAIVMQAPAIDLGPGGQQPAVDPISPVPYLVGANGTGNNAAPIVATIEHLNNIEAALNAVIAALKAAGIMAE